METLPTPLAQELRNFIGYPQSTEILDQQPCVESIWLVAGSTYEQESGLSTERHWLLSAEGHSALFLQFIPFNTRPAYKLFPGQTFRGELAFYPAAYPQRAGIRSQQPVSGSGPFPTLPGWDAVAALQSEKLARSPFAGEQIYAIRGLRPVQLHDERWLMEDAAGKQMQLGAPFPGFWKWMALSGGNLLPTIVVGDEQSFIPLGVWTGDNYIPFN
jgi:hypothetical protein